MPRCDAGCGAERDRKLLGGGVCVRKSGKGRCRGACEQAWAGAVGCRAGFGVEGKGEGADVLKSVAEATKR